MTEHEIRSEARLVYFFVVAFIILRHFFIVFQENSLPGHEVYFTIADFLFGALLALLVNAVRGILKQARKLTKLGDSRKLRL